MNTAPRVITEPIIFTASRLESIGNRFVFEPMGLTVASGKILKMLAEKGELTPSELGRLTGGTKSNISQRLNFLEGKGLIERQYSSHSTDRRQVQVQITDLGRQKVAAVRKRIEHPAHCLEQHFTAAELQAYYSFFAKLNQILDANEQELAKIFST